MFTDKRGRIGPVTVNLPPGYRNDANKDVRYPVIYMMHGYGQTPEDLGAAIIFIGNWMNSGADRTKRASFRSAGISLIRTGQSDWARRWTRRIASLGASSRRIRRTPARSMTLMAKVSGHLSSGMRPVVSGATKMPAVTTMVDAKGNVIAWLYSQRRFEVAGDQIADTMKLAIVSIEDKRFAEHNGVDWKGTLTGLTGYMSGDDDTRGGSTIEQQYVKNYQLLVISQTDAEKRAAVATTFTLTNPGAFPLVLGERIGLLGVAGMLLILGAVAGLGEEAP